MAFAVTNVVSRVGGSPQHPVGNGLLAEQFPPERRGFAISAHISGGNVGTVVAALAGPAVLAAFGWRGASILFGIPAALVALAILRWVRETGADRAAAIREGTVREAVGTILARRHDQADVPRVRVRRRRPGPRRGEPVLAPVPDPRPRPARVDDQPDVRGAHRPVGADAARRGLAVRPARPAPDDRRRLPRRRARVHRVHHRGLEPARPVGRHRDHGPVLVRREPAAPGAPRRRRPDRASATSPSRCTSRSRSASARSGPPSTARSSRRRGRRPACRSSSA